MTDTEARHPDAEPVLELSSATIADGLRVTFSLTRGELLIVQQGQTGRFPPLADAIQGMLDDRPGAVRFLGRDWREATAAEGYRLRGRIGRLFPTAHWISHLSVAENVIMALRHHTDRPRAEALAKADELARSFGLDRLSRDLPHATRAIDLHRAACVRAFLGEPDLILLEPPPHTVFEGVGGNLSACVVRARERGAAILWMTQDRNLTRFDLDPSQHFELTESGMVPIRV